ncbi:MAG TPA: conjugal transfer protein TraG N-terminal domain-containing protein [Candidatus Nitrosotenuis sp.]|nr:conjugal transfer protein TraG N-terminal domain-containing protein [Candidatus Nitrosotenuis sp.]
MAWLATWPVVMTVLNMLGHMYAAKAIASELLVGLGSNLTLLTQTGMAEAAYNAYCWIMGLQLSVPFLSWALISGGGYAFSQMASSLTQTAEWFALKAGMEKWQSYMALKVKSPPKNI